MPKLMELCYHTSFFSSFFYCIWIFTTIFSSLFRFSSNSYSAIVLFKVHDYCYIRVYQVWALPLGQLPCVVLQVHVAFRWFKCQKRARQTLHLQVLIPQIESKESWMKWQPCPFSRIFNDWQKAPEVPYLLMMESRPSPVPVAPAL